ncbi:MAG: RNA polymerase sigma factor [Candidatus Zixiibacteriota bacterium]
MAEAEERLIQEALEGDQEAYRKLFEAHQRAIHHIIAKLVHNREEVRDLVQETFIKAFNSLESYRKEYRFTTWLYKIAANNSIDYLRKKKIESLSLDRPLETEEGSITIEIADSTYSPDKDLVTKEKRLSIKEAIDSLPPKYREVIVLRHQEDRSYEQISGILSIPIGTVKARIFRAREFLKKKLKSLR